MLTKKKQQEKLSKHQTSFVFGCQNENQTSALVLDHSQNKCLHKKLAKKNKIFISKSNFAGCLATIPFNGSLKLVFNI